MRAKPLAQVAGWAQLSTAEQDFLSEQFLALTPQRRRFVLEYLVDRNATQAAIRAGYRKRTARQQGERLLTFVDTVLQPLLRAQEAQLAKVGQVSRERWLLKLKHLAFFDPRRFFSTNGTAKAIPDLDAATAAALAAFEVREEYNDDGELIGYTKKFKLPDKRAALELYGKATGFLAPEIERAPPPVNLVVNFVEPGGKQATVVTPKVNLVEINQGG